MSVVKRYLLLYLDWIVFLLSGLALIGIGYVLLLYSPLISSRVQSLGIELDSLGANFLAAVIIILTIEIPILNRLKPWLKVSLGRRLFPINRGISEKQFKLFDEYHEDISVRIKKLLPSDLKENLGDGDQVNRNIISMTAEEVVVGNSSEDQGRIKNLMVSLDLEFFSNLEKRVLPITLQGEPGSGKSTLIFELYRQQARRLLKNHQGWIPIIVFAHELSWELLKDQENLLQLLVAYFRKSHDRHRRRGYESIANLLEDYYDQLQFLIIIDGLDEIPDRPLYDTMSRKLNELLETEWKGQERDSRANRYLVTCRSDDDQRLIKSRLISLLPMEYHRVIQHFKKQRRFYGKKSPKKQELTNVIDGLEMCKSHRLLQNYISNPYLLSLIVECLRDVVQPPARRLNEVFAHVLERELGKPRAAFEAEKTRTERRRLHSYLSSLMAPYCYHMIMRTLYGEAPKEENLNEYIRSDKSLAGILFGSDGRTGYLRARWERNSQAREVGFAKLSKLWGDEKTSEFSDRLETFINSSSSEEDFVGRAIASLYDDALRLLQDTGLAEVNLSSRSVARFRHRRMQDYFMGLFIDKAGIASESGLRIPLGNAWMREPIRILAATSSNPEELLDAFHKEHDKLTASTREREIDYFNEAANLLLNASEATAYLPKPQSAEPDSHLHVSVIELGEKAQELYLSAAQKVGEREKRGWLDLENKCLIILRNIYASEYLAGQGNVFRKLVFDTGEGRVISWRWIHNNILQEYDSYQHIAYAHLYPIKTYQPRLPIGRHSLFYYVMDAVLLPTAYRRVIKETHPEVKSRLPLWALTTLEKLLSLSIFGFIVFLLWAPQDNTESVWVKVWRILLFGITLLIAATLARTAMRWFTRTVDFYHVFTWGALKICKIVYRRAKPFVINVAPKVWPSLVKRAKSTAAWSVSKSRALFRLAFHRAPLRLWVALKWFVAGLFFRLPRATLGVAARAARSLISWMTSSSARPAEKRRYEPPPLEPVQTVRREAKEVPDSSWMKGTADTKDGFFLYLFKGAGEIFVGLISGLLSFVLDLVRACALALYGLRRVVGILLIAGAAYVWGVPLYARVATPISEWIEEKKFGLNFDNFSGRADEQVRDYDKLRAQANQFLSGPDTDENLGNIGKLIGQVTEAIRKSDDLTRQADTLAVLSAKYSVARYDEIRRKSLAMAGVKGELNELQRELLGKQSLIIFTLDSGKFIGEANELIAEAEGYTSAEGTGSLPPSSRGTDKEINYCVEKAGNLVSKSYSLQNNPYFKDYPGRQQILLLTQKLQNQYALLQKLVNRPTPAPPPTVADPAETMRASLRGRTRDLIQRSPVERLRAEYADAHSIAGAAEGELKAVQDFIRSPKSPPWNRIARLRGNVISSDLKYLDNLVKVDSEVKTLKPQLEYYQNEVNSLLREVSSAGQLDAEKGQLEAEARKVKQDADTLRTYEASRIEYDGAALREGLETERDRTAIEIEEQYSYLLKIAPLLILLLIIHRLIRLFGNRKGRGELDRLKEGGDFDTVLNFIKDNPYSIRVNETAVEFLKTIMPIETSALKKISNAAEARLNKHGDLNESVGHLLRNAHTTLDKILDRKLGPQRADARRNGGEVK